MDSTENGYRSHYGIAKLQDHNYHTWSHQCQLLLSENKVWDVVAGKSTARPKDPADLPEEERSAMTASAVKAAEKAVAEWDDKDETARRIISFTVLDRLQGPIYYGKTAKGAWEELQRVHAPKDMQRKYSLMRRLFNLGTQNWSSIRDLEETFDVLVYNLSAVGKEFPDDELIMFFSNGLPAETFRNWIQGQMAFVAKMSITDFKGRVREEARRLNLIGGEGPEHLDPDAVQGNLANSRSQLCVFPPRKPNSNSRSITCYGCGEQGHIKAECPNKRIAEEYIAKQVAKLTAKQGQGQQ
jgi:gag-polypeptide of LTR copia-type/Zinc knuckle